MFSLRASGIIIWIKENIVLKQLVNNEDYTRKVIPFLNKEYFADINEQIVFEKIKEFIDK